MSQDKVSRLSDSNEPGSNNVKPEYKPSYGDRWDNALATKKVVFGFAVAAIVLTIIVGFNLGGWVTGSSANTMSGDAVVQRLSSICVNQYNEDLGKVQKLRELNEMSSYRRDNYVAEQGWATMPGDEKPDRGVAAECAKLLVQIDK